MHTAMPSLLFSCTIFISLPLAISFSPVTPMPSACLRTCPALRGQPGKQLLVGRGLRQLNRCSFVGAGQPQFSVRPNGYTMVLAADGGNYDEIDLKKMKVLELKELCKSWGLSATGKKADLIQTLLDHQSEQFEFTGQTAVEQGGNPWEAPPESGPDAWYGEGVDPGIDPEVVELPPVDELSMMNVSPDFAALPTPDGMGRMVTLPRTGNCWHGLFFDIENLSDKTITIHAVKTGSSPEPPTPVREDRMTCSLYQRDGPSAGFEKVSEGWELIGQGRNIQLPTVSYGEPDAYYGAIPLDAPIILKPKAVLGFCVFTDSWRGVVLRAKLGGRFQPGDPTDEDAYIRLAAGLLPVNDGGFEDGMFKDVYSESCGDAFVGAIEYTVSY